jgi:hypothetical protein
MFTTEVIGPVVFYFLGAAGITWGVVAVVHAYLRDPVEVDWSSRIHPHPPA